MPEGPEVRRYADALHHALSGGTLTQLTARTRLARAWLEAHPDTLIGRRVERVMARGKNLVGYVEGGYYFYSHLMMWGRWIVTPGDELLDVDRRERARVVTASAQAILMSAPVFEIGEGNPFQVVPYLASLGPDILPYPGEGGFAITCFLERLEQHPKRSIGAALLDQTVAAGIGNYLRAEILYLCCLDPWRTVETLTGEERSLLCRTIANVARQAYTTAGQTVPDEEVDRMRHDPNLRYPNAGEWSLKHWVFRRTNLPCLRCGDTIRQKKQVTYQDDEGEKERVIYFCPTCQKTTIALPPVRKSSKPTFPVEATA